MSNKNWLGVVMLFLMIFISIASVGGIPAAIATTLFMLALTVVVLLILD